MATKKDLVEAHAFSRRRLVTAFVSGAPGGREVEPPRPLRAVIGGAALCVLLLAGAAIAGVFAPRTPEGWLDPGQLIVSKEKGSLYLVVADGDGVMLRQFVNATSAQLLLGEKDPVRAAQEEIGKQAIGPDIGVLGVPSSIPASGDLVQSGWTACTATGQGIMTRIAAGGSATEVDDGGSDTEVPAGAKVVQAPEGQRYLIAYAATEDNDAPQAVSFRLPGNEDDRIIGQLGLGQPSDAVRVDPLWLSLFKQYSAPLDRTAFQLGGSGAVTYSAGLGGGTHRIGDLVSYDDETYVLTQKGAAKLTPFALAVYLAAFPGEQISELAVRPADTVPTESVWSAAWPKAALALVPGDACAVLDPRPGETPSILLGRDEVSDAAPDTVAGSASAVRVQPGTGALVRSGSFDDPRGRGTIFIDSRGTAYGVADATTIEHLGYADVDPPAIPDSWLELFESGTILSAKDAG